MAKKKGGHRTLWEKKQNPDEGKPRTVKNQSRPSPFGEGPQKEKRPGPMFLEGGREPPKVQKKRAFLGQLFQT